VDADDIYLAPDAAFRLVQVAARDTGEVFPVSDQTLRKRLNEKHLLASVDSNRQTLTVRRTILGCLKRVLHFSRDTILPKGADDLETEDGGEV
jgi:hypothetical protein